MHLTEKGKSTLKSIGRRVGNAIYAVGLICVLYLMLKGGKEVLMCVIH